MPENDEILKELEDLRKLVSLLRENEQQKLKLEYESIKGILDDAIFSTQNIEVLFENTLEKLELTDFLNELTAANNPSNDSLGFNFIEVVNKNVEATLTKGIENVEGAKNRFLDIVSKVINNPIADIILKSNPVGAVVSNVMNAASNFINTTKVGGGLQKIEVETRAVISLDKLKEFEKSMSKYVVFYTSLLNSTNSFNDRLDFLRAKNSELAISLKDYHFQFLKTLGLNPATGRLIEQFENLFKVTQNADGSYNYNEVLNKSEVKEAKKISDSVPDFKKQVDLFVKDFTNALNNFIDAYLKILNDVYSSWNDSELNKAKLKKLINRIEDYKQQNIIIKGTRDNIMMAVLKDDNFELNIV